MSRTWLVLLIPTLFSLPYLILLAAKYISFAQNRNLNRVHRFDSNGNQWSDLTLPPSNPFSLPHGETDMCLKKPWRKHSIECLQVLLEAAYGPDIIFTCPNLADKFVAYNCAGCPWDNLNQTSIEKFGLHTYDKPVFHKPTANCSVAEFTLTFREYYGIYEVATKYGIPGLILLSMCTTLLAFDGAEARTIGGAAIPEPIFMSTVWILFNIGTILVASVDSYFYVCESEAGSLTLFTRILAYFAMLWASIRRYLHLRSRFFASGNASWYEFLANCQHLSPFRRGLVHSFYYGSFTAVLLPFIVDMLSHTSSSEYYSMCNAGSTDVAYGLYQYSKLLLEIIAITVYSFGASDKRLCRFWLRSAILFLLYGVAVVMFSLELFFWDSYTATTLITRTLDSQVAGYTELVHIMVIALLGLLEPFRSAMHYESSPAVTDLSTRKYGVRG